MHNVITSGHVFIDHAIHILYKTFIVLIVRNFFAHFRISSNVLKFMVIPRFCCQYLKFLRIFEFHESLDNIILHIIDIFNLQVREQHLAISNANDIWLYGNSEDWLRLYDNGHYP